MPTREASDRKMRSTGNAHEVALELALDEVARPGRQLARDVDAVASRGTRPQARGNQIERDLAQRRALDRIQRPLIGAAVFLEPALEQDRQRRLAARGRPEQQQQPPADVGAGGGGLEVVDDARQRLVDAEQLALEQLARALASRWRPAVRRDRASAACPRCIRGWSGRAPRRCRAGPWPRKSPNVPSQRCARCSRLKELSESMNAAVLPWEFWSTANGRIVLPSR